ncbi:MAG: DNA-binding protein [Oscillatoriales cyanobacterium]|uniref:DNA-binding protein n=1 Tax=Microcoleus anatoxicus PTRS2 TaxID=2705321 RepID=A0ABU8YGC5_9CYAN|nr:MAG: DNA-binding protein [Oscillatoriales cyanobacterium]TAD96250.1 MAG: DNA-binding protein [Oscillatoriales cyanobacterium]TAE05447.1 MAG: DNA-binding protein [Oscillatoriales cyanobacterium]TAF04412.1 MAG: DNA-binding protein [Oscillatoriales cyanobacterium]TAF63823.1 MAG: DNA-binding protein [Oscillatoriales cyanobacterium]
MTNAIKEVLLQKFSMGCLFLALTSGLLSCANLPASKFNFGFNVSKISAIQQKRQVDTEVYLQGKVENRAPFVGKAAYQLQDASGSIWVLTKQALPQLGDEIMLKGQVRYKSIKLKGLAEDLGEVYIEEVELLQRKPITNNQ